MRSQASIEKFISDNRISILIAVFGLFLVSIGGLSILVISLGQASPEVEVIPVQEEEIDGLLVVDVQGAVIKPGVYELPAGSRVNDVLVKAGGLSAEADRGWIAKHVNLAQKLADGVKIYIPSHGQSTSQPDLIDSGGADREIVAGVETHSKININTASVSELDSLWGIGEKRAAAIIENRPYTEISEIKGKAGIPRNVFERIKDEISIF